METRLTSVVKAPQTLLAIVKVTVRCWPSSLRRVDRGAALSPAQVPPGRVYGVCSLAISPGSWVGCGHPRRNPLLVKVSRLWR